MFILILRAALVILNLGAPIAVDQPPVALPEQRVLPEVSKDCQAHDQVIVVPREALRLAIVIYKCLKLLRHPLRLYGDAPGRYIVLHPGHHHRPGLRGGLEPRKYVSHVPAALRDLPLLLLIVVYVPVPKVIDQLKVDA